MSAAPTALAAALARRAAEPDEPHCRLDLLRVFLHTEVVLQLAEPASESSLRPALSQLDGAPCVMAFDSEATMAAHAGGPAPYAAMTGEVMAELLAGQGLGVALIAQGDLAEFLGTDTLDWLAAHAAGLVADQVVTGQMEAVAPDLPAEELEALAGLLEAHLWALPGLTGAMLVGEEGRPGQVVLVISGVPEPAQASVAAASARMTEAAGVTVVMDIGFVPADQFASQTDLGRVLSLAPPPAPPPPPEPVGPGMDPDRPPRLR